METKESILELLFGNKPNGYQLYIWTKHSKGSTTKWFENIDLAISYAEKVGQESDTYFGIGMIDSAPVPRIKDGKEIPVEKRRIESSEVSAVTCLWIDVDYADDVHRKTNLPPTKLDALEFIKSLPIKPTVILHSGHGYQAYWIFNSPFLIQTEADRGIIGHTVKGWQKLAQEMAKKKGWEVDSTFDLSRVYRVNNTKNFKADPVLVTIDELNSEAKYELSDFQPYMRGADIIADKPDTSEIVVRKNAGVNREKLEAMIQNIENFRLSWEHKRTDFPSGDSSISAYDFSIAVMALQNGWSLQETCDLLVHHRALWKADAKYPDYYRITIEKAWIATRRDSGETAQVEGLPYVSGLLRLPLVSVVKIKGDTPVYVMILNDGRKITFDGIGSLMSQYRFKERVAESINVVVPSVKKNVWDTVLSVILSNLVEPEVSREATSEGLVEEALYQYLIENPAGMNDDREEKAEFRLPFMMKDGRTVMFFKEFENFVKSNFSDRDLKLRTILTQIDGVKFANTKVGTKCYYTVHIPPTFIWTYERKVGIADAIDDSVKE